MSKPIRSIHERVLAEIRRRKLKAYGLAKDTGIPEPTLHRFMKDGATPTTRVLEAIMGTLGWDIGPVAKTKAKQKRGTT